MVGALAFAVVNLGTVLVLVATVTVGVCVVVVDDIVVVVGTILVGVCVVVVDEIVVVVDIDRCTEKVFPAISTAKFHSSSEYRSASRALV